MSTLLVRNIFFIFFFSSVAQGASWSTTKVFSCRNGTTFLKKEDFVEKYIPCMAALSYKCSNSKKIGNINYDMTLSSQNSESYLRQVCAKQNAAIYLIFDEEEFEYLLGYVIVFYDINQIESNHLYDVCDSCKLLNTCLNPVYMIGSLSSKLYQKYGKFIENDIKACGYNGIVLRDLSTNSFIGINGFEEKFVSFYSYSLHYGGLERYLLRPENLDGNTYKVNVWVKNL
ncbi:hypothetical protein JKY79_01355 [Candidatus Babeliales bacterium]|nr:hypothetical protein [Candidatus Babeliales bacterium]